MNDDRHPEKQSILFTVVVPLFNKQNTIARAISSVLNQTYEFFELIVIDDGSTDHSLGKVQVFQDERIRVYSQPNGGAGIARNNGISRSNGDYLCFLDADDEWSSHRLAHAAEQLRKSRVNVLIDGWQVISKDGNLIDTRQRARAKYNLPAQGVFQIDDTASNETLANIMSLFCTNTITVSKKEAAKYNNFSEASTIGEDWYLWLCLLFNNELQITDNPVATVYEADSGIVSQGRRKWPLQAYFCESKTIRNHTPDQLKTTFDRLIALLAAKEAHLRFGIGRRDIATTLLKRHPNLLTVDPADYLYLQLKRLLYFKRTPWQNN